MTNKSKKELIVELEARNIKHQEEILRIMAVRDITEKREKDRLSKESNEKFSTLVNQKPNNMTGYEPEELIGSHLWEHTTKLEFIKMAR